jgi:hypothetical protein
MLSDNSANEGVDMSRWFKTVTVLTVFLACSVLAACDSEDADCPPEICNSVSEPASTAELCTADQGDAVNEDPVFEQSTFRVHRIEEQADRYYLILEVNFLQYIVNGLTEDGPGSEQVIAELEGLITLAETSGTSCDGETNTRTYLVIEQSADDIIDLALSSDALGKALEDLADYIDKKYIEPIQYELYKLFFGDLWGTALFLMREDIKDGVDAATDAVGL